MTFIGGLKSQWEMTFWRWLNNNLIFQLSHRYSLISSCPVAVRVTFSNFIVHWRLNLTAFYYSIFDYMHRRSQQVVKMYLLCGCLSFSCFSILLTYHRRSSEWHVNQQRYCGKEELRSSTKFFRLHLHRRARRSSMSFQFRYLKPPSKAAGKVKRLWKKTNDDDFLSLVNRRKNTPSTHVHQFVELLSKVKINFYVII